MGFNSLFEFGRGARMRKLFDKGKATSRQILEVEFGHFPPKGIDFADQNHLDTRVNLRSSLQDKDAGFLTKILTTTMALGYVHGKEQVTGSELKEAKKDQSIYMNPILMGTIGKLITGKMTYTGASMLLGNLSLAGLAAFAHRYEFLLGTSLLTTLRHVPIIQIVTMPFKSFSDVVGHEHIHVLQIHDGERAKTGFDMDEDHFKGKVREAQKEFPWYKRIRGRFDRVASLGVSSYFLNDVEIQARLHTLMVHGYKRWGRLPGNREEFTAAAIDCGLNAPREVHERIKASKNPNVADFLKPGLTGTFMRCARKSFGTDTAEINAAQRAMMDKDLQRDFWKTTLPFMYGHLLELYGDPYGRRKMGYTKRVDEDGDPIPLPKARKKRPTVPLITDSPPPIRGSVPEVPLTIRYPRSSGVSGFGLGA